MQTTDEFRNVFHTVDWRTSRNFPATNECAIFFVSNWPISWYFTKDRMTKFTFFIPRPRANFADCFLLLIIKFCDCFRGRLANFTISSFGNVIFDFLAKFFWKIMQFFLFAPIYFGISFMLSIDKFHDFFSATVRRVS